MILNNSDRNCFFGKNKFFFSKMCNFSIFAAYHAKSILKKAMTLWESNTCVNFTHASHDESDLVFMKVSSKNMFFYQNNTRETKPNLPASNSCNSRGFNR